jgi:ribosomal protein L22
MKLSQIFQATLLSTILTVCMLLILGGNYDAKADKQPESSNRSGEMNFKSPKAKERMDMIKKMKLLEVLNMEGDNADKFLLKYNSYEKQIEENRKVYHRISKELSKTIKPTLERADANATPNTDVLKKLQMQADSMLILQNEFNKISQEKMKAMKSVLSDWQYVKYVDFESNFMKKLFNTFIGDDKHRSTKNDKPRRQKNNKP